MMYLGIAVSIVTLLGGTFAAVMYIANSANAPVVAQLNQVITTVNQVNGYTNRNGNDIQLIKQSLNSIDDNKDKIDWILYRENLPKQITILAKDVEYLKKKNVR